MKTREHIKPNTVLPRGAVLVPPFKKTVGGWVEQEFDATCERFGLTWLRVKDGLGNSGDREDWIVDIPSGCVSVHDYEWRKPYWGLHNYPSFDKACAGRIAQAVQFQQQKAAEHRENAKKADTAVAILKKALALT